MKETFSQASDNTCVCSALKLIPSASSPEVLSKFRLTSLEGGSSVSESFLVASQSSKEQDAFAWFFNEQGNK